MEEVTQWGSGSLKMDDLPATLALTGLYILSFSSVFMFSAWMVWKAARAIWNYVFPRAIW